MRTRALICALTLTVTFQSPIARATYPGANGFIYISMVDGTLAGWTSADGSNRGIITPPASCQCRYAQPTARADGRIALISQKLVGGGDLGALLLTDDTGAILATLITAPGSTDLQHPAWSPDGKQIAFERSDLNGTGIWIINADGTNLHALITPTAASPFAFEPDW